MSQMMMNYRLMSVCVCFHVYSYSVCGCGNMTSMYTVCMHAPGAVQSVLKNTKLPTLPVLQLGYELHEEGNAVKTKTVAASL